jgi:hypothetical protein
VDTIPYFDPEYYFLKEDRHMIKKHSGLTLFCIVLLTAFTNAQTQEKKANAVSIKRSSDGYRLSINVNNLPLEKLLEKLTSQFPLRVITYGVDISPPVTINFKDLSLERGIKLLLKESGINNHFIQYTNDEKSRVPITVLTLLGNGTKTGRKINTKESMPSFAMKSYSPEDEFAEKITALKERYEWADEETKELAGFLLELMPEPARDRGVEALMNELDEKIEVEGNDKVDEEIFFQALEHTVPSHLAPAMMDSIQQYSQRYKAGTRYKTDERLSNQIYQEVMTKRLSNRNNNLKGGSSYDYRGP